jgi:UDP-N-acetylmuramoyl-tripeptide--D-alanyl-D-alanine ligase
MNYKIKVNKILEITNGELIVGNENFDCEDFITDTRNIIGGEIYIGLMGDNKNGGTYFEQAFNNGASGCIVQDVEFSPEQINKYKDKITIRVEDTLKALQEIAKYKRSLYGEDFKLVAITGSVGKTSTKDIVANVLSTKYKTLKTEGNYNNHIGVPLTILRLKDHEAAVVEMGMNHFGEISVLTNIAKPSMCVITNIGTSHIGNLGSRENILKSKLEILEGNKQKELIINNDNDLLHKFYIEENKNINITTYGIEEKGNVYATNINQKQECTNFMCHIDKDEFEVEVPVGGIHFVYNALCAATVGNKLGLSNEQIKKGIETFELTKKRMDISILKNGTKIINDSYNASFESMQASITNLANYTQNRKIAVLGDMFELGDYAEELHKKVGSEIAKNNIDILICAGENAKYIAKQANESGMDSNKIHYFENKDEIISYLNTIMKENDVILFKASNGMRFFDLVEKLKKL